RRGSKTKIPPGRPRRPAPAARTTRSRTRATGEASLCREDLRGAHELLPRCARCLRLHRDDPEVRDATPRAREAPPRDRAAVGFPFRRSTARTAWRPGAALPSAFAFSRERQAG